MTDSSLSKMRTLTSVRDPLFVVVTGGICALAVIRPTLAGGLIVAFSALCVILHVLWCVLRGIAEPIILGWAAMFPLGYYFLSFPREKSVITLDRILLLVLVSVMIMAPRD